MRVGTIVVIFRSKKQVLLGEQIDFVFAEAMESELSAIFQTIFPAPTAEAAAQG
jgi:hypothetical protein